MARHSRGRYTLRGNEGVEHGAYDTQERFLLCSKAFPMERARSGSELRSDSTVRKLGS
jgi:hypothetical protein